MKKDHDTKGQSVSFWIPRCGSRIEDTGCGIPFQGNLDSVFRPVVASSPIEA